MGRQYKDRFSEASKESGEKSGFVCETCGSTLTKKQHESMIKKLTAGAALKEPAPFGP